MFLDADEKLPPQAFEHIYSAIRANKNTEVIFGGYRAISYSGKAYDRQAATLSSNRLHNGAELLKGEMIGLRPA